MASSVLLLLSLWAEIESPNVGRCGPVCLAVVARATSLDVSLNQVDSLVPNNGDDSNLSELEAAAQQLGLATAAVRWDQKLPVFSRTSAIVPVLTREGRKHFVTLLRSDGENVLVLDFPKMPGWVPVDALISSAKWDGSALHLGRGEEELREIRDKIGESQSGIWWIGLSTVVMVCLILFTPKRTHESPKVAAMMRSGFTLIEILVCISILGLVMSLLVPAVQASRETARAIQCRNHLKQFGLAAQSHHTTYGHFPASSIPYVNVTGPVIGPNLSVHVRLLPFLENDVLFKKVDMNEDGLGARDDPPTSQRNPSLIGQRVPIFECPSDRVPAGGTNYRVCLGTGPAWFDLGIGPFAGKVGAFARLKKRDRDIVDGLSQTAFFSEKLVGDQNDAVYSANRDFFLVFGGLPMNDPTSAMANCQLPVGTTVTSVSYGGSSWLFSGYDHTWYNHVFPPNASTPDCSAGRMAGAFTARSYHAGGVHVGFGDGSTRFVNDHIDLVIWRGIASRRGGEVVALDSR